MEKATWGKTQQLSWDRAYDKDGNLCFIGYYDAGNAAYAGYMKKILTVEERKQLFKRVENPREEMLEDVFELGLGILALAMRYPSKFPNWPDVKTLNACIRGLERSFYRYAVSESIESITAPSPRKRSQPKKNPEVDPYISESPEP